MIHTLCAAFSVSGHEKNAHPLIRELGGEHFDEIICDKVGNLALMRRCGRAGAPLLMIDTHLDEIGMLVTKIYDNGFLGIVSVGGLDPAVMQASDVIIYGEEKLFGVVASTPPHLKSKKDSDKLTDISELLIDTGYTKEELEGKVRVGTPVGFAPVYTRLSEDVICGKSFDDKACGAVALHAIMDTPREQLASDVCLLFSCHEETMNTGGVAPAAYSIAPDYAMVIDVNLARTPDVPRGESCEFGAGISIDITAVTDRRLVRMTEELCREKNIRFTLCADPSSLGTNTHALNLTGRGVPTVDIGLPLKCMHTPCEIMSMSDANALHSLVRAFITSREIAEVYSK